MGGKATIALSAALLACASGVHAETTYGRTTRVVVYDEPSTGTFVHAVSADGRRLAFTTQVDTETTAVVVRDLKTGTNHQLMLSGVFPRFAGMSADGNVVAVNVSADVPAAGDANGKGDGFVWRRNKGTFTLATLSSRGEQGDGNSEITGVSADGTKILITSVARNFATGVGPHASAYVRDLETGTTTLANVHPDGRPVQEQPERAVLSADGTKVLFATNVDPVVPGDPFVGAFLHDMVTGTTVRASWRIDGTPDPETHLIAVDGDGSHVAWSFNGVVMVRDMAAGVTRRVIGDGGFMLSMALSEDGRFLTWDTVDGDAVVLDLATGLRRTVSTTDGGVPLNATGPPSLTADGSRAWFSARQSTPVFTVGIPEAYVHELDVPPGSTCPDGGVQRGAVSGRLYDAVGPTEPSCELLVPAGL